MLNYSVLYFSTLTWSIRIIFCFLAMDYLCDSSLVLIQITALFNVKTTLFLNDYTCSTIKLLLFILRRILHRSGCYPFYVGR